MSLDLRFDDIEAILQRSERTGTPSEIHGMLTGMLCIDATTDPNQWMRDYFGEEAPEYGDPDRADFEALYLEAQRQLLDEDLSFNPLLPDEEEPLERRAGALCEWCHGFLQGIGYSGRDTEWPGECTEILKDFLEIIRLDPAGSDEADEVAYMELTEYVRMGVKVIQSELDFRTPEGCH